jgi:hypothetical protein
LKFCPIKAVFLNNNSKKIGAQEASSLRKCAVRLALDEYLARVLSAELSFEEEHVDDGEEEDVDHHKQQVASVVLSPRNIVKHFRRKHYCFCRIISLRYNFVKIFFIQNNIFVLFGTKKTKNHGGFERTSSDYEQFHETLIFSKRSISLKNTIIASILL